MTGKMIKFSKDHPIGQIIAKESNDCAIGYYYPDTCQLSVYYYDATEIEAKSLLLEIEHYIDINGLWSSFDKILIIK